MPWVLRSHQIRNLLFGMENETRKSGPKGEEKEDPSNLLERLTLQEDEIDDLVWEDEIDTDEIKPKWLALGRLLTAKTYSHSALIADMRASWNPAQAVVWRRINANLFSIQFNCLGDWNKAIHRGPWDFHGYALILTEYDGFSNPEKVKLDRLETWCQIHRLPDGVLKSSKFLENLASRIGDVQEVQVTLPNGFVGEFVRVRVKLDVHKKLTRVVCITKAGETEKYRVKFEKLPTFCYACGIMGHWHEECGTGEYDATKFEWGPFLLASRSGGGSGRNGRGSGASRGQGHGARQERGDDPDDQNNSPFGRGRGAGLSGYDKGTRLGTAGGGANQSWRFNHLFQNDGSGKTNEGMNLSAQDVRASDGNEAAALGMELDPKGEALNVLGKRSAQEVVPTVKATTEVVDNSGAIVPAGFTAGIIDQFEGADKDPSVNDLSNTPRKSEYKKKFKGVDGTAVDSASTSDLAASVREDRQSQ